MQINGKINIKTLGKFLKDEDNRNKSSKIKCICNNNNNQIYHHNYLIDNK